jgi:uncharacterized protein YndB with AHSA1/START domain
MLRGLLERGEAYGRMLDAQDPLRVDVTIPVNAPTRQVFDALVDVEQVRRWSYVGEHPVVEPRVGGRYSFGWASEERGTDGPDRIVELQDGYRVAYDWHGTTKTLVSWTVEQADGEGCRLRVQHSGFVTDPKMVTEYKLGWAHFLYAIAELVVHGRRIDDRLGMGEGPGGEATTPHIGCDNASTGA